MLSGVMTAVLIILFAAIAGWAWGRERNRDFQEAALLPLENHEPRKPTP